MIHAQESNVSIETGTFIRFFLVLILVLALYYILDVVLVVIAAIVIASSVEPVIQRLERHRIHRVVGVILVYIVLAAIIASLLIFFLPIVIGDSVSFLSSLPSTVTLEQIWSPLGSISGGMSSAGSALAEHTVSVSQFISDLQTLIVGTGTSAFQTASSIFGGLFSFILIVVLSFYLAVQREGVDDFLKIVTPVKHHDYIINLWRRSQHKIGLWLQGQIVLGIVVGVLVYLVLMVVGIPHALLLAVLAGLFEIIPVFGPIISSVPAILLAFSERGVGTGLLLVGLYIIIYQFESQIFYPLVVKKIVGISPIVVILALVVGAKLAGVLGALIAVPLSAAFMEYIHDIEKFKKAESAERAMAGKN